MTDHDPCHGCPRLVTRPSLAPWCERGTYYGETGCVRHARAAPAVGAPVKTQIQTQNQTGRQRRRG